MNNVERSQRRHGDDLWERTFPPPGSLGDLGGISEGRKGEIAIRREIRRIRRKN